MLDVAAKVAKAIPFDTHHLDRLLAEAGIDVLVVTSKHNIQYLFGGYRFFFFDYMDAIGVSRYLPILVYRRGKPEDASYIGYRMEAFEKENGRFWTPLVQTTTSTSMDAARFAVEHIKRLGKGVRRIGVEVSFMPSDAAAVLQDGLEGYEFVDAQFPLERLRARRRRTTQAAAESSEHVVAAMLIRSAAALRDDEERDRRDAASNEVNRGLTFEYCLITAGTSQNRASTNNSSRAIFSRSIRGNYQGYIGDLCRMGILASRIRTEDLLGFIEEVSNWPKPSSQARGREIFAVADAGRSISHKSYIGFCPWMGLVSHEAPRLTSTGRYLALMMPIGRSRRHGRSIETTMKSERGFIKLEDTVA